MYKVVHIVESLGIGGLENLVIQIAIWQKEKGYQVSIISLSDDNPLYQKIENKYNIPLVVIKKNNKYDLNFFKDLKNYINNNNVKIIHTHNARPNYYSVIFKFLYNKNIKIINTRHGLGSYPIDVKKERIFKLSSLLTDHIVFVSRQLKDFFITNKYVFKKNTSVIINSINFDSEYTKFEDSEDKFKLKDFEGFVLGTIVRLNAVKNIKYLLDIFTILSKIYSKKEIKLLIVGDGPLKKELYEYHIKLGLKDRVIFTGFQMDVFPLLKKMDAFILTSLSEGIPLTILEAMSLGKIIFSTPVGGIVDVIRENKNGLFLPLNETLQAAKIINETISNEELCSKIRENSKRMFYSEYSFDKMMYKYESVYKQILEV